MTILVTGAQGYLGRYVVAQFLQIRARVVGVGRSARREREFTHDIGWNERRFGAPLPLDLLPMLACGTYSYEQCDLTDAGGTYDLVHRIQPGLIIHLAGALRDEASMDLFAINHIASQNLCRAAALQDPQPKFVMGSSGSVYGSSALAALETGEASPIGHYGISKYEGEKAVAAIAAQTGLPLAIIRIFNLIGPGVQQRHLVGLVAHAIAAAEHGTDEARLTLGDLQAQRDFIDVRDVANMIRDLPLEACGIINAGSGRRSSARQVVDMLLAQSRTSMALHFEPANSRVGADILFADTRRMHQYYVPRHGLAQSLAATLGYARWSMQC